MIKKIVSLSFASCLMGSAAMALQVDWQISASAANFGDDSIIGTGGLTYAVGTFAGGFEPSAANTDSWVANWNEAGLVGNTASWTNLGNASFPAFGTTSGETVVRPEGPVGSQGYVFGFTSLDLATVPDWILLTNASWTFPAGTAEGGIALPGADWKTIDAGTTMVFGGAFNHPEFAADAQALSRTLQTQAIPEPSTYALIFGLGILGFLGFRRFRK